MGKRSHHLLLAAGMRHRQRRRPCQHPPSGSRLGSRPPASMRRGHSCVHDSRNRQSAQRLGAAHQLLGLRQPLRSLGVQPPACPGGSSTLLCTPLLPHRRSIGRSRNSPKSPRTGAMSALPPQEAGAGWPKKTLAWVKCPTSQFGSSVNVQETSPEHLLSACCIPALGGGACPSGVRGRASGVAFVENLPQLCVSPAGANPASTSCE